MVRGYQILWQNLRKTQYGNEFGVWLCGQLEFGMKKIKKDITKQNWGKLTISSKTIPLIYIHMFMIRSCAWHVPFHQKEKKEKEREKEALEHIKKILNIPMNI